MAQHFGGAPDVHGLLSEVSLSEVVMVSLSEVATVFLYEVGTVSV